MYQLHQYCSVDILYKVTKEKPTSTPHFLDYLDHGACPTTSHALHRHIGLCRTTFHRAAKRCRYLCGRGNSELHL